MRKVLNMFILGFISVLVVGLLAVIFLPDRSSIIVKPQKYNQALSNIANKQNIAHFPTSIPSDAKNVQLYCYTSDFNGEILLLKFNINKTYIEQELNNHKFINSDVTVGTEQNIYFMPSDKGRISSDDFTFYVLKNEENEQVFEKFFPYFNGIGISKNLDAILYYYIEPAD